MGTTPNRGFPYPEGTDYVASGDDAIEALAMAVDGALTNRLFAVAEGGPGESVAANTDWVVDYAEMTGGPGFTAILDGGIAPRFTYTGSSGRWFLISVGVSVSAPGSTAIALNLVANGGVMASAVSGADDTHLTISLPAALGSGTDLSAYIRIDGAAGSFSYPWLRAVSL